MPIFLFLSSQCLTLGSRFGTQLVNTKALYNVFWYPFSGVAK
ncbi:MAG: hypothetical protein ACR5LA_08735 [Wolbachia sp.]